MDFPEWANAAVLGIPLMFVVYGLVGIWGRLGAKGKWQLLSSLGTGVGIGILYRMSLGIPTNYTGWFEAVIYGLGLGILASLFYDEQKLTIAKSTAAQLGAEPKGRG